MGTPNVHEKFKTYLVSFGKDLCEKNSLMTTCRYAVNKNKTNVYNCSFFKRFSKRTLNSFCLFHFMF